MIISFLEMNKAHQGTLVGVVDVKRNF